MNTKTKTILVIVLLSFFSLIQCKTTSLKQTDQVPFSIKKSIYYNWIGGQPGISGTKVQFTLANVKQSQPDSLYFKGKVAKLFLKNIDDEQVWEANFTKQDTEDRQMTIDSQGEYGNHVPVTKPFPFVLAENEAMIKYTENNKSFYYKVVDIIKKNTVSFP